MIPDEIAIQSAIWNSAFRKNIYDIDDQYHSCLRKIDWKCGEPYELHDNDYEELMNSDCLFAREFSSNNMTWVNRTAQALTKQEKKTMYV